MALLSASDELKVLLDANIDAIKADYLTLKLFVDSAVREKMRRMGMAAGEDEIIAHLKKLEASKSRHVNKQIVRHAVTRHKKRVARAKRSLNKI
jgi:hypothetical protein